MNESGGKWINRIFLKMRENVVYFPDSFMSE